MCAIIAETAISRPYLYQDEDDGLLRYVSMFGHVRIIPMNETSSVFKKPTINARAYLLAAE